MTGWAERRRIADLEWRMVRQEAEEHTCNECGAPPGGALPKHPRRHRATGPARPLAASEDR